MTGGLGLGVLRASHVGHARDGARRRTRGWCKSRGLEVIGRDVRCEGKSRGRQGGEPGARGRTVTYQYYNADLLDIPRGKNEDALAYVDDTIMLATAETFNEAHIKLADMMGREGGVSEWSKDHNSPLEYSKLALIDFAHRSSGKLRTTLQLPQISIEPSSSTKYLGVMVDQNLNWKAQQAYAVGKGTKWVAQIR
jgi:hypothetical protein